MATITGIDLALVSSSFANGGRIPERFAGSSGMSPALSWTEPPPGTACFVVIMDDPDAVRVGGRIYPHWQAIVPAGSRGIPEGASRGGWGGRIVTLTAPARSTAYKGPMPPAGDGEHRYVIELFAMRGGFAAAVSPRWTREQFRATYGAQILASAQWMGRYGR